MNLRSTRSSVSAGNETEKKRGTDPYCPPVWATPLDDAPLIIQSDKELPAGTGKRPEDEIVCNTAKGGGRGLT